MQKELTPNEIASMSEVVANNKMITTKVFSVEDGTLQVINNIVVLWDDVNDEIPIATTPSNAVTDNVYTLPSTLIRTPKTDEDLAEEEYPYYECSNGIELFQREGFLAGRKSFGDTKFHLSEFGLKLIYNAQSNNTSLDDIIKALNPPIYPTKITVEHDGDNYLWETLKASYE